MSFIKRAVQLCSAAVLAVFTSGLQFVPVSAYSIDPDASYDKVWVCKYVTTPQGYEILKTGNDGLVSSSVSSVPDPDGNGVHLGDNFTDQQSRSVVIAWNDGGAKPDPGMCPGVVNALTEITIVQTPVCGPNNDTITWEATDGVTFTKSAWVDNSLTVTATLKAGFSWTDGTVAPKTFPFTDANVACESNDTPATAADGVFTDSCGPSFNLVFAPVTTEGVVYTQVQNGNTITVNATAEDGYVLTNPTWSQTQTDMLETCVTTCVDWGSVHSTNLQPNGWTTKGDVTYVDGGIKLTTPGNWESAYIYREMSGTLA